MQEVLDKILNTNSKIKIIRLFISRRQDFIASGRQIARMVKISPPAVHVALKDLYNQNVLKREIIGRQHLYSINNNNRVVKNILVPTFTGEFSIKGDIINFLKRQIVVNKLRKNILSIILYGSFQMGETEQTSDVDIAIIVTTTRSQLQIERIFIEKISEKFYDQFGIHLDTYIKTKTEFLNRLKKNLPPVSTLIQSYSVIYGKDPIDLR